MKNNYQNNAKVFKAFCDENELDYKLIEKEWLGFSNESDF